MPILQYSPLKLSNRFTLGRSRNPFPIGLAVLRSTFSPASIQIGFTELNWGISEFYFARFWILQVWLFPKLQRLQVTVCESAFVCLFEWLFHMLTCFNLWPFCERAICIFRTMTAANSMVIGDALMWPLLQFSNQRETFPPTPRYSLICQVGWPFSEYMCEPCCTISRFLNYH